MKNRLSTIIALTAALLMIMSAVTVAYAPAIGKHNADAIWVETIPGGVSYPSSLSWTTSTMSVGDMFSVQVGINMSASEEIFSWQVLMSWPSWLNCTSANYTYTDGSKSEFFQGHITTSPPPSFDYALDTVLAFETLAGTDYVTWTPARSTLFNATFVVISEPGKANPVTNPWVGAIDISFSNGTDTWWNPAGTSSYPGFANAYDLGITYYWAAPTKAAYFAIEGTGGWVTATTAPPWPFTFTYDEYEHAVGRTFTANVYIENLDPAWYIYNASFSLSWNNTVIDVLGVGNLSIAANWGIVYNYTTVVPGSTTWNFGANYTGTYPTPSGGRLLIASLTFTVLLQENSPPYPLGWTDTSALTFSNNKMFDAPPFGLPITQSAPQSGTVVVQAYLTLSLPFLEVTPSLIIIGPSPSIGSLVYVNVSVENLTEHWNVVGIQFRLAYNDSILGFVSASEGPFMTNSIWDLYGTFPYYYDEPSNLMPPDSTYPGVANVICFELIYPNSTTGIYDQTIFPNTVESAPVDPTLSMFTFQVLQQNCFDGANITTYFNLLPFWGPDNREEFIDKNSNYISSLPDVNGTVIIEPINEVERVIDLFGGAVNDGYGNLVDWYPTYPSPDPLGGSYLAFPAPYGGQGPNAPMDIAFPQTQVYLNAYVTYNYWPVQAKDVGFEVEGPFYHVTTADNGGLLYNATGYLLINTTSTYVPEEGQTYYDAFGNPVLTLPNSYQVWAKFTATTDQNGVANYTYRMPWPCDDPDSITGVWQITATVTVADQVVTDTMLFYYQRLVYITSVSTDMYGYYHDQYVKVTVNYETHSTQMYPALFAVVGTDNLSVPFAMATQSECIGGAVFCHWLTGTFTVSILIPKWAYAGDAYIDVSVYDKDPTVGGEAWEPEFTPAPEINIYPYNLPLQITPSTGLFTDDTALTAVPAGQSGYVAETWWNLWPNDYDLAINNTDMYSYYTSIGYGYLIPYIGPDQMDCWVAAIGGLPWMAPNNVPSYNYTWYFNGTADLAVSGLMTTSECYLIAGQYPINPIAGYGAYQIVVVVADKVGDTATTSMWIYVHSVGLPPGP